MRPTGPTATLSSAPTDTCPLPATRTHKHDGREIERERGVRLAVYLTRSILNTMRGDIWSGITGLLENCLHLLNQLTAIARTMRCGIQLDTQVHPLVWQERLVPLPFMVYPPLCSDARKNETEVLILAFYLSTSKGMACIGRVQTCALSVLHKQNI